MLDAVAAGMGVREWGPDVMGSMTAQGLADANERSVIEVDLTRVNEKLCHSPPSMVTVPVAQTMALAHRPPCCSLRIVL
jgi:hypothetical protein